MDTRQYFLRLGGLTYGLHVYEMKVCHRLGVAVILSEYLSLSESGPDPSHGPSSIKYALGRLSMMIFSYLLEIKALSTLGPNRRTGRSNRENGDGM